jgi:hypothetical protein
MYPVASSLSHHSRRSLLVNWMAARDEMMDEQV